MPLLLNDLLMSDSARVFATLHQTAEPVPVNKARESDEDKLMDAQTTYNDVDVHRFYLAVLPALEQIRCACM